MQCVCESVCVCDSVVSVNIAGKLHICRVTVRVNESNLVSNTLAILDVLFRKILPFLSQEGKYLFSFIFAVILQIFETNDKTVKKNKNLKTDKHLVTLMFCDYILWLFGSRMLGLGCRSFF